jgi:hypothetical protein
MTDLKVVKRKFCNMFPMAADYEPKRVSYQLSQVPLFYYLNSGDQKLNTSSMFD